MAKTRISPAAVFALAGAGLLVAAGIASPAAAEPGEPAERLVAELETDRLGPAVSHGQLRTESGGFNSIEQPAALGLAPGGETSAIILWDDCCSTGRGVRGRATNQGTIKATSYR